jgi:hypothetical protein
MTKSQLSKIVKTKTKVKKNGRKAGKNVKSMNALGEQSGEEDSPPKRPQQVVRVGELIHYLVKIQIIILYNSKNSLVRKALGRAWIHPTPRGRRIQTLQSDRMRQEMVWRIREDNRSQPREPGRGGGREEDPLREARYAAEVGSTVTSLRQDVGQ